jgi:hypothetical protein
VYVGSAVARLLFLLIFVGIADLPHGNLLPVTCSIGPFLHVNRSQCMSCPKKIHATGECLWQLLPFILKACWLLWLEGGWSCERAVVSMTCCACMEKEARLKSVDDSGCNMQAG